MSPYTIHKALDVLFGPISEFLKTFDFGMTPCDISHILQYFLFVYIELCFCSIRFT